MWSRIIIYQRHYEGFAFGSNPRPYEKTEAIKFAFLWSQITKHNCSLRSNSAKCSRPRLACLALLDMAAARPAEKPA